MIDTQKFRMVVNKHAKIEGSEGRLSEKLNIERTDTGNYAYLNECIADNDSANFVGLNEYEDGSGTWIYADPSTFSLDLDSAVITFSSVFEIPTTLYAFYWGGGSIIWADDIRSLQDACKVIDNNALYKDGSVALTGDLNLNGNAVKNVTTVNNVNINTHKHLGTGIDNTEKLGDDSISSLSISKISGLQNALNAKQDKLPAYQAGKFLSNNGSTIFWNSILYGSLGGNIYNQTDLWNILLKGLSYDPVLANTIGGYPKGAILRVYEEDGSYQVRSLEDGNTTEPNRNTIKYRDTDTNKKWECIERTVIKSFKSGYSWYRLYSDGWCEQGGRIKCIGSVKNLTTIIFQRPFVDTTYNIHFVAEQDTSTSSGSTDDLTLLIRNPQLRTCQIFAYDSGQNNYDFYARWDASGYVLNQVITELLNVSNLSNPSGSAIVEVVGDDIEVDANDVLDIELAGAGTSGYGGGMLYCHHIFTEATTLRLKKIKGRANSDQIGLVLFTVKNNVETPVLAAGGKAYVNDGAYYGGSGYTGGNASGFIYYKGYSFDGSEGNSQVEKEGACGNKQSYAYGGSGYVHPDYVTDENTGNITQTAYGSNTTGNGMKAYARIYQIEE